MQIEKKQNEGELVVVLTGKLDAGTSGELQESLETVSGTDVKLDLCSLEYISSAGLRVLLALHKQFQASGHSMTVVNCNDVVQDIFNMTGFTDVLNIG